MTIRWSGARSLPSTLAAGVVCALLAACGRTVTIQGTADEVWADTIEILGIQGVMPARVTAGQERPRVDRDKGEIDLVYAQSVYYGEGAAFIQVDVAHPARNAARTVRMWVDFPVGNRVVRYGRALDEQTTDAFAADFEVALRKFRARNPPRRPPTPEEEAAMDAAEQQAGSRTGGGQMTANILLLGSGELGKEFVISAKRLGCRVVAVDRYGDAPAMQVADAHEVVDMLDGRALSRCVRRHRPDFIVPEIEAIRTSELLRLEKAGHSVVPSAFAAHMTMNRDAIRELAAKELGLRTARYAYASSARELADAILSRGGTGLPCVVKPTMSSSGKGQSVVRTKAGIEKAWRYAIDNMRGDRKVVIVEEFIDFDYEITQLTVKERAVRGGGIKFVEPIGHRQERGDYQESWMPCPMKPAAKRAAQRMAAAVVDRLSGPNGAGIFGVEFFVRGDEVIFSELSPRPHDTGMVTLRSQDLSEFDLHLRAILGLPIPEIRYAGPTASAVVLATRESDRAPEYSGVDRALSLKSVEVRIFGKPSTRRYRRMGVVLAHGASADKARATAMRAAALIKVR